MDEPSPEDHALLERAHLNTFDFYGLLARHLPAGALWEADGLVACYSGLPIRDLNLAWAMRLPSNPARALREAREFYAARDAPWQLQATDAVASALESFVTAAGLAPVDPVPGLLMRPVPALSAAPPAELVIQEVSDIPEMERFVDAVARAYAAPREIVAALATPGLLATPDLHCYTGFVDGEPIACAVRYTTRRIAGVGMVGTAPEQRGRGIGAALTWRAVREECDGPTLGAYLQASALGFNVYHRMGFRHILNYHAWDG